MYNKENKFDSFVARSILANNQFGITEVFILETLRSLYFDKKEYDIIERLIKEDNIKAIKEISLRGQLPENKNGTSEYLEILRFKDQRGKDYIVTVYDSNELLQDPQIIEIYSLPEHH
jgi:hypothetical protein